MKRVFKHKSSMFYILTCKDMKKSKNINYESIYIPSLFYKRLSYKTYHIKMGFEPPSRPSKAILYIYIFFLKYVYGSLYFYFVFFML